MVCMYACINNRQLIAWISNKPKIKGGWIVAWGEGWEVEYPITLYSV